MKSIERTWSARSALVVLVFCAAAGIPSKAVAGGAGLTMTSPPYNAVAGKPALVRFTGSVTLSDPPAISSEGNLTRIVVFEGAGGVATGASLSYKVTRENTQVIQIIEDKVVFPFAGSYAYRETFVWSHTDVWDPGPQTASDTYTYDQPAHGNVDVGANPNAAYPGYTPSYPGVPSNLNPPRYHIRTKNNGGGGTRADVGIGDQPYYAAIGATAGTTATSASFAMKSAKAAALPEPATYLIEVQPGSPNISAVVLPSASPAILDVGGEQQTLEPYRFISIQPTATLSIVSDDPTPPVVGFLFDTTDDVDVEFTVTASGGAVANHAPVASCVPTLQLYADGTCKAAITAAQLNQGSLDPDGDTLSFSMNSTGPLSPGNQSLTLTVTDSHGASSQCTSAVTVIDATPPVEACPGPITVTAPTASASATVTYSVAASDNCAVTSQLSTPGSGQSFPVGTTSVTSQARDASGNVGSCSFPVTVLMSPDTAQTATGSAVAVTMTTPTIAISGSFANVSTPGLTWVVENAGAAVPEGTRLGTPAVVYDVATTAQFGGAIELCFQWSPGEFVNDRKVRLLHFENGAWTDVTVSRDPTTHTVCGSTTSLSPFALVEPDYRFAGFFSPVSNVPTFNVAKAGRSVPLKFSLGHDFGLDVFANGYPLSQEINCDSDTEIGSALPLDDAGNSGLSYDALANQYVFAWKTDSAWAGTCRQMSMRFDDGSVASLARFRFTK